MGCLTRRAATGSHLPFRQGGRFPRGDDRIQIPVIYLVFVAFLVAGPLTRYAEPANAPSDTATATIDPHLSQVEDDFLSRQAQIVLGQVNGTIPTYPPQLPEPPVRRMALLALDGEPGG